MKMNDPCKRHKHLYLSGERFIACGCKSTFYLSKTTRSEVKNWPQKSMTIDKDMRKKACDIFSLSQPPSIIYLEKNFPFFYRGGRSNNDFQGFIT